MNAVLKGGVLVGLLAGTVLGWSSAPAMMLQVEPTKLAGESFDVIEGTVVSRESAWNSARTHITTRVTIEVRESWTGKASSGEQIVVVAEGGTVDGLTQWVEHEPVFGARESVVLFLESRTDGALRCLHAEQGKYTRAGDYVVGSDLEPRSYSEFRARLAPAVGKGGEDR